MSRPASGRVPSWTTCWECGKRVPVRDTTSIVPDAVETVRLVCSGCSA